MRAVFGRLEHPTQRDADGKAVSLGSRPRVVSVPGGARRRRRWRPIPMRARNAAREIRSQVQAHTRKAVAYYDFMFSPVKSVSVYWTALLEAGRDAEAANVVAAHRAGVAAAMAYVEQQAAYVRTGYHGKTRVRAVGRGVRAGPRAGVDPLGPLHQPRATTAAAQPRHGAQPGRDRRRRESGALASRGFKPIKQAAEAIYTQAYQRMLQRANPVVFAWREDGKARRSSGSARAAGQGVSRAAPT